MKRYIIFLLTSSLFLLTSSILPLHACTNLVVGKKASKDGSVIISYSQDDYGAFEPLRVIP
ncbi:MAG: C69 family dipeptidase, partial [Bacteroidaceae bacterium]|nr:C69 family dipeptidase [Bacteroidaceae bacterium]